MSSKADIVSDWEKFEETVTQLHFCEVTVLSSYTISCKYSEPYRFFFSQTLILGGVALKNNKKQEYLKHLCFFVHHFPIYHTNISPL